MGYSSRQNTKSSNVFSEGLGGGGAVKEIMEIFSQVYNFIDKRQILKT